MGNCMSNSKKKEESQTSSSSYSKSKDKTSSASDSKTSNSDEEEYSDSNSETKKVYKFLLVGAGEAGKSTFFKLVTNKTAGMYESESDLMEFSDSIYDNIVEAFKTVLTTCDRVKVFTDENGKQFDCRISEELEDEVELILSIEAEELESSALDAMKKILDDDGFQTCLHKLRHLYYVPDGSLYFFSHLDRIITEDYIPTFSDILNCRDRTTGVTHEEIDFKYKNKTVGIDLFDVGGQRAERKAWKKIFDGVDIIGFVMPMSEFDQTCMEDNTTNRSVESLMVLKVLNDSPNFVNTPILLLITKVDQLEKKMEAGRKFDLQPPDNGVVTFEPYDGDSSIEDIKDYLLKVCMQQIKNEKVVVPSFKNLVGPNVSFDDEFTKLIEAAEALKKK